MSRKRICIADFDLSVYGGVERVSASLANALADHFEVFFISLCMKDKEKAFELDPRIHYRVMLPKEDRLRYMRKELKSCVRDYFRENKIDAAVLQGNYTGYLIGTTCAKKGTKLIFVDHGALMNQWDRKDIRFIRWIASRRCEKTVTLTEESKKAYQKKFRLAENRVRCIYNWIEPDPESSQSYDGTSQKVISAGRFTYEKGFERLIDVWRPVAKKHPEWRLDLFGDGELREKVEEKIREYQLEEQIALKGNVDDLKRRYKEYAMYVLPSDREGMPLVLLEAKQNRLPIVSFDIQTGPKEIVADGVNGLLVEPYDTEKMAEAICRLIEDPDRRRSMSDHSQDDLEKFSKEEILKQWIELLEE